MGRGSSLGDLSEPGIKPASSLKSRALEGGFFTTSTTWEAPYGQLTYDKGANNIQKGWSF